MTLKDPDIPDHSEAPGYPAHFTESSEPRQLFSVTEGKRETWPPRTYA